MPSLATLNPDTQKTDEKPRCRDEKDHASASVGVSASDDS